MIAKDERLAKIATSANVAQFVSFGPGAIPPLRYSHVRTEDFTLDERSSVESSISALMHSDRNSRQERSVNIRTFRLGQDKGNPFRYGLTDVETATSLVQEFASQGYYTIVNETIDTHDGGVSGVALGGIVEFTPMDTPRGVEQPGAVSLPHDIGSELLNKVYGFRPDFGTVAIDGRRLEFSVHPFKVGYRSEHTVLWEVSEEPSEPLIPTAVWPNRLSKFIGDKAYGLLMASLIGLDVPASTVVCRNVAPFSLGRPTGTKEVWMRTCPEVPQPGRFPTTYGWSDPFALLSKQDNDMAEVVSVLSQESVSALYSGTGYPDGYGKYVAEGVAGYGDDYMLGREAPTPLPNWITQDVQKVGERAESIFGPVRFEFVHDGQSIWVVQLHRAPLFGGSLFATNRTPELGWRDFEPAEGLDRLRALIEAAGSTGFGIRVSAPIGVTSHVGELLREADIPWTIGGLSVEPQARPTDY